MGSLGNATIFARNLNYYLSVNSKTRTEVCDALGFKYSTFSEWATGKKYPRIDKIEQLAQYFGITKSDLIEDQKTPPAEAEDEISIARRKVYEMLKSAPEEALPLLLDTTKAIVSNFDKEQSK